MIQKVLALLIILSAGSCDLCDSGSGQTAVAAPQALEEATLAD